MDDIQRFLGRFGCDGLPISVTADFYTAQERFKGSASTYMRFLPRFFTVNVAKNKFESYSPDDDLKVACLGDFTYISNSPSKRRGPKVLPRPRVRPTALVPAVPQTPPPALRSAAEHESSSVDISPTTTVAVPSAQGSPVPTLKVSSPALEAPSSLRNNGRRSRSTMLPPVKA